MKRQSILVRSGFLAAALSSALVAACSSTPPREGREYTDPGTVSTTNDNRYAQYGRVTRIDTVQEERRSNVGVGTVLGAVVGGALGNQVGSGTGRTAATVAGAVGGAVVGNQVDRNRASSNVAGLRRLCASGQRRLARDPGRRPLGARIGRTRPHRRLEHRSPVAPRSAVHRHTTAAKPPTAARGRLAWCRSLRCRKRVYPGAALRARRFSSGALWRVRMAGIYDGRALRPATRR